MDQKFKIRLLKRDIRRAFDNIDGMELDEDEVEELIFFLSCSVESIKK